jgi:hypothetical protein
LSEQWSPIGQPEELIDNFSVLTDKGNQPFCRLTVVTYISLRAGYTRNGLDDHQIHIFSNIGIKHPFRRLAFSWQDKRNIGKGLASLGLAILSKPLLMANATHLRAIKNYSHLAAPCILEVLTAKRKP